MSIQNSPVIVAQAYTARAPDSSNTDGFTRAGHACTGERRLIERCAVPPAALPPSPLIITAAASGRAVRPARSLISDPTAEKYGRPVEVVQSSVAAAGRINGEVGSYHTHLNGNFRELR